MPELDLTALAAKPCPAEQLQHYAILDIGYRFIAFPRVRRTELAGSFGAEGLYLDPEEITDGGPM